VVVLFFGNVNQVLVRLWARNQLSVAGGQLSESLMTGCGERAIGRLSDRIV
jgi:hypothetical protein